MRTGMHRAAEDEAEGMRKGSRITYQQGIKDEALIWLWSCTSCDGRSSSCIDPTKVDAITTTAAMGRARLTCVVSGTRCLSDLDSICATSLRKVTSPCYQMGLLESWSNEKGTCTSPSWSDDLPIDVLLLILQRLELPQSLAFASVCKTWRAAAIAAGVPRPCTPWILSWAHLQKRLAQEDCPSPVTCNLHHLLDGNSKAYGVSFPRGCFTACCGASHGWLVLVDELSNLVLYNPFTTSIIPLPPITDFSCVEAVYSSEGSLEGYRLGTGGRIYGSNELGTLLGFYQKAVLSCSPSKGGDYTVMIIHHDSDWLSFVKAGQKKWQVASTLAVSDKDRYADCAYHDGRFYTVTFHGTVEKWDVDGLNGPTKEVVVAARRHVALILSRHLVPTPWGDLLQVRAIRSDGYPDGIRFQIHKVGLDRCKRISYKNLMDHALLLGLNHSACLHTKDFPGLQAQCIYFSVPWMVQTFHWIRRSCAWGGVRIYDFKHKKFERALPICNNSKEFIHVFPTEVWITPNL